MPKDLARLARQMRGRTATQVQEAVAAGNGIAAVNLETNRLAMRYIHPETRRSVVIDDQTGEIIHVGGDGFIY